jgi:hypothetical protein
VSHDHSRADVATQRAALAVARAILLGDSEAAAVATAGAPCTVCLVLVTAHLAIGLAAEVSGEAGWPVSEQLRARLLAAITETEREIGAAPNLGRCRVISHGLAEL